MKKAAAEETHPRSQRYDVRGGDDAGRAGLEHPMQLADEAVGILQVFDTLDGYDKIVVGVCTWNAAAEIGVEKFVAEPRRRIVHDIGPERIEPRRTERRGKRSGP